MQFFCSTHTFVSMSADSFETFFSYTAFSDVFLSSFLAQVYIAFTKTKRIVENNT